MTDVRFDIDLGDGRIAHCEEAANQPYQNCEFSAGQVEGIDPDVLYLKIGRDGQEPSYFFFRPDELAAVAWCASGALWSHLMMELNK